MSKQKKLVIIIAVIFGALLISSVTILPILAKNKATEAIQQATGRLARIESISINPFTLTVEATGVVIEAKGGGPFITCAGLRASISPASLYKRALILADFALVAPSFSIARTAPNRYSFTDIIERSQAQKKADSHGLPHFSINNITVTNGTIDFDDQIVNGGRLHTVRNLEFAIPFISNMPYLLEKYTDPKLSALVDGALFKFAGKVKPFSKSMATEINLKLNRLDLPRLAAYSPLPLSVELVKGAANVDIDVHYRVSADKKPQLIIGGVARLDDVVVTMKNGQPLLRLPAMDVKASKLDVFARQYEFKKIALDGLELFVSRDAKGHWMYEQLLPHVTTNVRTETEHVIKLEPGGDKAQQPLVMVSAIALTNGSVHLNDAVPKGGFKGGLTDIDFTANNFSTAADTSAEYDLSLLADTEASFSSEGSFSLSPLAVKSSTGLADLNLQKCWPYLARFLTAPLKGTLDLSGDVSFSKANGLTAENGSLTLKNFSTRYGDKEGVALSAVSVSGAAFKQQENRLVIAEVKLSKGTVSLSREAEGKISALGLLVAQSKILPQKKATALSAAKNSSAVLKNGAAKSPPVMKPFSYSLKRLQLDKLNLQFCDKTRAGKPLFFLRDTGLLLLNLNGPRFTPAQLSFASTFGSKSPLKVNGIITPQPFHFKGEVNIGQLPIRDFEEYFPENMNVVVIGGFLDTALKLDVSFNDGRLSGTFKGNSGIRDFHSIDMIAEEDLLKWESLQLDDFEGSLEPLILNIREIALNGVYSRVIVRKDGTLNLQNLMDAPDLTVVAASAPQQNTHANKRISIGAVTIQDGTLSFNDTHLPQQFATTFYNIGGRVSGLTSAESGFADVDLRGNLENHSPLQITGKINPLRDDLYLDLKVSFNDIELSPISPYSGSYLGYTVEKGKLFLDLKYHIEKKLLSSENSIFIDQFNFGNRIESDKATNLPVKLALALLKDRKGEIHLDVPVIGSTADPQFNIWKLVFQAMKNLMVKAVTSPLSLLSSMFGSTDDFRAVQFGQGTSVIAPQEEQKLNTLAKALLERPGLKISLKGYVDREKDGEAYRRELLSRVIRNEKILAIARAGKLKADENADTILILPEEYVTYLTAVYKKGKFPKPRNVLGLAKELSPDEMSKLIITNTIVGESELKTLARERVVAVMDYLVNRGKIPAERIFQNDGDIFKAPEKESISRSRVELNVLVQ